jgi:vancomycin resistance protein YoaR
MSESAPPQRDPKSPRAPAWLRGFRGPWSPRDVLLLCVCPLLGLGTAYASERVQSAGYVLPGVSVDGTDVSGYAAPVLDAFLQDRHRAIERRVIRVRVGKVAFRLSGADAGVSADANFASQVMAAGRSGNILGQVGWRVGRWFSPQPFSTQFRVDEAKLEEHLKKFEQAALTTPTEGGVRYISGKIEATYPSAGETIERRVAMQLLGDVLNGDASEVMLPTVKWSPSTTREGVDDAKRRFTAAVQSPVEMFVRFPESEVAPGKADGDTEEEQQGRVETIAPSLFASALVTRPSAKDPAKLELAFDLPELDKGLVEVRKRWERPAVNAQFIPDHHNRLKIEPSKAQWLMPSEPTANALLEGILSDEHRGVWTLIVGEQPKVTTELAHQLNIKQLVSTFTTFHPCCKPRVENIHRIADLINGTVVLPGETYSVNASLGERRASNGFTMAPTIVKGEMDDTVGGGISQFATTLFNAVLRGGYEIIERQPHSIYFNRYPMGHEATLSFPKPDLIFRNDTQSGMVIKTSYNATSIKVMVFGDNNGRVVTTDVSKPFDTIEPKLEYVGDPELPPDEEKVEEKGDYGFTVYASRTVREKDGTERKETRKVIYNPRARRLVVHPCKIPEGAEGYTGEKCPEPEDAPDAG